MNRKALSRKLRTGLRGLLPERLRQIHRLDFFADGLGVRGKNLGHFEDPGFVRAWSRAFEANRAGWARRGEPPDLRWRAHVCCWAARHALTLEGDFVECGVHTGLLSMTVCEYIDLNSRSRRFYLYDTFEGIPVAGLGGDEAKTAAFINERVYSGVWEIAQRNFAPYPGAILVRGALPGSIDPAEPARIAYLSIDLNSATYEHQTIQALWDRITPGALIVIDDYAFRHHERQYAMWNAFAAAHGTGVLTLPTGQGLMIKPG